MDDGERDTSTSSHAVSLAALPGPHRGSGALWSAVPNSRCENRTAAAATAPSVDPDLSTCVLSARLGVLTPPPATGLGREVCIALRGGHRFIVKAAAAAASGAGHLARAAGSFTAAAGPSRRPLLLLLLLPLLLLLLRPNRRIHPAASTPRLTRAVAPTRHAPGSERGARGACGGGGGGC